MNFGACRRLYLTPTKRREFAAMDWTLEVVVVPVTDVDRAKTFYTEKLGFNADVDTNVGDSFRVVQLTPPGSNCSITIGPLVVDEVPENSARLQLCVLDIEEARAQLIERNVEVSEITSFSEGGAYDKFFFLEDPDGNNWAVQEVPAVRPGLQAQAEDREA
jgi:catechol 2,3-dioxygenase-like lactoylglutathione lyase family enzyme